MGAPVWPGRVAHPLRPGAAQRPAPRHLLAPHVHAGGNPLVPILHGISDLLGGIGHVVGLGASQLSSLPAGIASAVAGHMFSGIAAWIGRGATYLLGQVGVVMSWSTSPQLGTVFFMHEVGVMALLAAAVAVPLLLVTSVQAVVQQDAGILLRALLVRAPLALLLTGVAVQLVSLGLAATDDMCGAILHTAGVPVDHLFTRLASAILRTTALGSPIPAFAAVVVALAAVAGTIVLWLELALRAAAIQAATLFLPLALVGVIWPATSHWARRLGETLTALVLSKLVVVAVLALAAGDLSGQGPGGFAAIVSGLALLMVAVLSPFALFRLVPMIEAGAVGHLEGLARRPHRAAFSAVRRSVEMAASHGALQVAGSGAKGSAMTNSWADGSGSLQSHEPVPGSTFNDPIYSKAPPGAKAEDPETGLFDQRTAEEPDTARTWPPRSSAPAPATFHLDNWGGETVASPGVSTRPSAPGAMGPAAPHEPSGQHHGHRSTVDTVAWPAQPASSGAYPGVLSGPPRSSATAPASQPPRRRELPPGPPEARSWPVPSDGLGDPGVE